MRTKSPRRRPRRQSPEAENLDRIFKFQGTDDSSNIITLHHAVKENSLADAPTQFQSPCNRDIAVICGSAQEFYDPLSQTQELLRGLHLTDPGSGSSSQVLHVPVDSVVSRVHASDCPWDLLDAVTGSTVFLAQAPSGDRQQFTISIPIVAEGSDTQGQSDARRHDFFIGNTWSQGVDDGGAPDDKARLKARLDMATVTIGALYNTLLKHGESNATCTVVDLGDTLPSSTSADEFDVFAGKFHFMVDQGLERYLELDSSLLSTSRVRFDPAYRREYVNDHIKFVLKDDLYGEPAGKSLEKSFEGVRRARQ